MNTERQKNPERTWLPDASMSVEGLSELSISSPLGIIAVDLDGVIRFWNKAAENIMGWREDEVLGRSIEVLSQDQGEMYGPLPVLFNSTMNVWTEAVIRLV